MARGQTRVVLNREALAAFDLAAARGLESLAREVLRTARPPDLAEGYWYEGSPQSDPYSRPSTRRGGERERGAGLVERGGYVSYVDGKRVGGDPEVKRKPKAFTVRGRGVGVAVGYGFPGRFIETGTEHQPPRPFLTPAVVDVVGDANIVGSALRKAFAAVLARNQRRYATAAAAKGG